MKNLFYWILLSINSVGYAVSSIQECSNSGTTTRCDKIFCCGNMGGISHCDSLASRYVCNSGEYSSCYCSQHATMDIQKLSGCCLWQGGVLTFDIAQNLVICRNGGISTGCSH